MYAPEITARAVAATSAAQGWDLVYHSPTYLESAIVHFESLLHDETLELTRPLTAEESRFIQNERRLCALDFRYWAERYAHIIGWEKTKILFAPNVAQKMVLDVWASLERKALAIIMQKLKARQLGSSTVDELAVAHRVQFHARTKAVVASADPKKTIEMGQMIDFCWDQQPWWLLPKATKIEKGMPVEFGDIDSSILIQAGNQFHGVARGQTPNVAHLSEVASWENAAEDIDASLLRAIHETPDVFVILESTAEGRNNWWHDNWQIIKEDWPRGRSRICPMFLPWFVGTDIYPTPTELRARPVPPKWIPSDRTIHHAERARQYVLANPLLKEHLAKGRTDWIMPRAQMWFYEIERETATKKKALNTFLREMPADDLEAFQNTGRSVVDQDVIIAYRERVPEPLGVYTIMGPGIHRAHVTPQSQWDPTKPPITVRVAGVCRSQDVYQFIPIRFEGYPGTDPMFKLFVWEMPEDDMVYGVGVDTGDGIGEDWSVLEGFRKGTATRFHAQTCEYASPYIKAQQLWPMALALGAFYSTFSTKVGRRTQCRICVECKGNGEIVQDQLKFRGWYNFHPWKRYDNKKRIVNANVHKEGIFTNVWFKSMMLDTFLTGVDEESVAINSPWLIDELSTLERDPEEVSASAAYNTHDDRVMGFGFPMFSLTVDDLPGQQTYRRSAPEYLPDAVDETESRGASFYASFPTPDQARPIGPTRPTVFVRGRGTVRVSRPDRFARAAIRYNARQPFRGR